VDVFCISLYAVFGVNHDLTLATFGADVLLIFMQLVAKNLLTVILTVIHQRDYSPMVSGL
jgi:hypothetical protein